MQPNRVEKIVNHFGSRAELARLLGVSRAAVTQWFVEGLPSARAIELERLSCGELKATEYEGASIYE